MPRAFSSDHYAPPYPWTCPGQETGNVWLAEKSSTHHDTIERVWHDIAPFSSEPYGPSSLSCMIVLDTDDFGIETDQIW